VRSAEAFPGGVVLSVDVGTVRTGVAACDPGRILAYPVETVPAGDGMVARVAELADEYGAAVVVVGYPLGLDGQPGLSAQDVVRQARRLAGKLTVPVWLVDERLSTAQAQRRLHEAGRTVKTSRGVVDTLAAVGILESVLNALSQGHVIGRELEAICGWSQ